MTALITLTRNPDAGLSSGPDSYADNVSSSVLPEPSCLLIRVAEMGLLAPHFDTLASFIEAFGYSGR